MGYYPVLIFRSIESDDRKVSRGVAPSIENKIGDKSQTRKEQWKTIDIAYYDDELEIQVTEPEQIEIPTEHWMKDESRYEGYFAAKKDNRFPDDWSRPQDLSTNDKFPFEWKNPPTLWKIKVQDSAQNKHWTMYASSNGDLFPGNRQVKLQAPSEYYDEGWIGLGVWKHLADLKDLKNGLQRITVPLSPNNDDLDGDTARPYLQRLEDLSMRQRHLNSPPCHPGFSVDRIMKNMRLGLSIKIASYIPDEDDREDQEKNVHMIEFRYADSKEDKGWPILAVDFYFLVPVYYLWNPQDVQGWRRTIPENAGYRSGNRRSIS